MTESFASGTSSERGAAEVVRLGWFSSFNSKCGLAEYSKILLREFDTDRFDWTILASSDDRLVEPDDERVVRCWTNSTGSIQPLLDIIVQRRFDIVVFQFKIQVDFGFLSLPQLETVIACCQAVGSKVIVIFHATDGADPAGKTVSFRRIAHALNTADLILVHSEVDLKRLNAFGVRSNVELFPHGYTPPVAHDRSACRDEFGLRSETFVVGSHGFLVPNKGIDKLIEAFAQFKRSVPDSKLLLINSLYPIDASTEYLVYCQGLATKLGVADDIVFETNFLAYDQSLRKLRACDVIVYPYQDSAESSSGAVRLGVASGRPILCSPLPIFDDVAPIVHFMKGTQTQDICEGLRLLHASHQTSKDTSRQQIEWATSRAWPEVARLLQKKLVDQKTIQNTKGQQWLGHYIFDKSQDYESVVITAKAQSDAAKAQSANQAARIANLEFLLRNAKEEHYTELRSIYRSRSWRLTRPLRLAVHLQRLVQTRGLGSVVKTLIDRATTTSRPGPDAATAQSLADLSPRGRMAWCDLQAAVESRKSH